MNFQLWHYDNNQVIKDISNCLKIKAVTLSTNQVESSQKHNQRQPGSHCFHTFSTKMYLNFEREIPTNSIASRNTSADLITRAHNIAWW